MSSTKPHLFRHYVVLFIIAGTLSGCIRPITERTFTFTPEKTATIFGVHTVEHFGVCFPFLVDRRGTGLYLWTEFIRQRSATRPDYQADNLAGYEIAVDRGQTCHQRILDTFQAAVQFDLSTLPDGAAVTSADLQVHRHFSPLDPPRLRGTSAQCTVMRPGQATESWSGGIFSPFTSSGRPFIASRPARPDIGPHNAIGTSTWHLNVTNTVSEWVRGAQPNNGFVITPDLELVRAFYDAADEENDNYFCDVGITGFELSVTAAVPE